MRRNEIYEGQWVKVKRTHEVREVLHKGLIFIRVQEPADWDGLGPEIRLPFELEPYSNEEKKI